MRTAVGTLASRRASGIARATAIALAALGGACSGRAAAPAASAPPDVFVQTVSPERVTLSSEWVATLDGYANAEVRPQVTGYLIKRDYQEGAVVKRGDVLFEIDPRPFEVALTDATARVAQANAQLTKTEHDVARDTPLAAQRAIAQSQLDDDVAAHAAGEAALAAANAAVQAASLNVEFTKVTSLIDGVAAIATAQIGDLVGPTTLLTTVSQVDPIRAYFALSEADYLRIANQLNGRAGSKPWASAGLDLILGDESVYPRKGTFMEADREIDIRTGTIRVSAAFPNPDHTLRPGQFGRVRAETTVMDNALLVPQRAVTELQGMDSLRVVAPDNTTQTRQITTGPRDGTRWVISKGLAPGDRVVVEGPPTRDGTKVTPKPYVPPAGAN